MYRVAGKHCETDTLLPETALALTLAGNSPFPPNRPAAHATMHDAVAAHLARIEDYVASH